MVAHTDLATNQFIRTSIRVRKRLHKLPSGAVHQHSVTPRWGPGAHQKRRLVQILAIWVTKDAELFFKSNRYASFLKQVHT